MTSLSLSLVLSLFARAEAAPLADCSSGDAPAAYDSESCILQSKAFCDYDAVSGRLVCDMEDLGCNGDGQAWVVNYDSQSTDRISAFGTCEMNGSPRSFCCVHDNTQDGAALQVALLGTNNDEEPLGFHYDGGISGVWNLHAAPGEDMDATISARGGADVVDGADHREASYVEYLYGDGGNDLIRGHAGDDWMYGGNGADTMYGHGGSDHMFGGNGPDLMYGGGGDDRMHGGFGYDDLFGEEGSDWLHGGYGDDDLYGGPDGNVLCEHQLGGSGPAINYMECGSGYDVVSIDATVAGSFPGDTDCEEGYGDSPPVDWTDVAESGFLANPYDPDLAACAYLVDLYGE